MVDSTDIHRLNDEEQRSQQTSGSIEAQLQILHRDMTKTKEHWSHDAEDLMSVAF